MMNRRELLGASIAAMLGSKAKPISQQATQNRGFSASILADVNEIQLYADSTYDFTRRVLNFTTPTLHRLVDLQIDCSLIGGLVLGLHAPGFCVCGVRCFNEDDCELAVSRMYRKLASARKKLLKERRDSTGIAPTCPFVSKPDMLRDC